MFRPLKNFYFLSSKYCVVNYRRQKSLQTTKYFSSINSLSARDEVKRLLASQTEPNWEKILEIAESFEPLRNRAEIYVLNCCSENRLGKKMLSFLKFLINTSKLDSGVLKAFLTIVRKEKYYQPCHPFVYNLLEKFIAFDVTVAEYCVITLLENPVYIDKVVKICMENTRKFSSHKEIIKSLLLCNKIEEAFKLYTISSKSVDIEEFMLNYLQEQLSSDKISVDTTEVIINLIKKLGYNHLHQFYPQLSRIMNLINDKETGYRWRMETKPCFKSKCVVCEKNLETSSITNDEIMYLCAEFEKHVVSQYLSISFFHKNWNDFNKFLNVAKYGAVIDGLNYLYKVNMESNKLQKVIKILNSRKQCPLVISRRHIKGIVSKCAELQVLSYFTDNMEFDDIYILYAALKQGKGCLVFTLDKYGFVSSFLEKCDLAILQRWKETHFCKYSFNGNIIWPTNVRVGIQEENCEDPSEFKCHIVAPVADSYDKLFCVERVKLKD